MNSDLASIGRLIDVSAVYPDMTLADVHAMVDVARQYDCVCASTVPWATAFVIDQLSGCPGTAVTGNVAFPMGADSTAVKVAAVREFVEVGCRELDVVINHSALRSGRAALATTDLKAVVEAADGVPVKAIIEVCYLTESQVVEASVLAVGAGAAFIKTGTGWGKPGTTVEHVHQIRRAIGDAARIKVSGGLRDLDTLLAMQEAGASRFGIGVRSVRKVLDEAYRRAGATVPVGRQLPFREGAR